MKTHFFFFFLLFNTLSLFSQEQNNLNIKIIDKPINYNQKRKQLSIDYLRERHNIQQNVAHIVPKIIVLHYTGGGTLQSNFNYFDNVEIENARILNKIQSKLNVSAHFLVDRDGSIYRLMEETLFARHVIGLNYCSIGVENVGSKDKPLTQEQIEANIALVKYLSSKFDIEYLIGHSEYIKFRQTDLWKETNPKYVTYKYDPGDNFMKEVRKGLIGFNLKSEP